MLKVLPKFKDAQIVRSRDPAVLAACDIVVDVGGEFGKADSDPTRSRFDHHQAGFTEVFERGYTKIKLSSAGLVYKYFGPQIISELTQIVDEAVVEVLYMRMYSDMIQAIDAIDNGQKPYETDAKELYRDSTGLSARISRLNASWVDNYAGENERFEKALVVAGADFTDILMGLVVNWLPARSGVETAFLQREAQHYSGQIMTLSTPVPWKDHLVSVENQHNTPISKKVIFVLYPDGADGWRIQAVPNGKQAFASRLNLPEELRGLRDQELAEVSGVSDAFFVHMTGFIGGARSYAGAMRLAELGLQHFDKADI
jgi:uncharacterized UPF0160 family protein